MLHNAKDLRSHNWETEKCSLIGAVEIDEYEFGDVIEVDGKFYSPHTVTANREHVSVSQIYLDPEPEDKDYERNVICPYCGYEHKDSWEMSDEEDLEECAQCGGVFSYQRIVTVEYSSQPVHQPNPVKAKWVKGV